MSTSEIVNKVWNYAHVLRDDGVGYGDYVEQITYLIFLEMTDERLTLTPALSQGERGNSDVPKKYAWAKLVKLDGDAKRNRSSELQYRHTLEALGKLGNCSCVALTTYIPVGEGGMLGTIFRKVQNKIQAPAKLERNAQDVKAGDRSERWKSFKYDELITRDKTNLDIFWLKDESLEDTENLPAPEVLAQEIVKQLEAALEEFRSVEEVLAGNVSTEV